MANDAQHGDVTVAIVFNPMLPKYHRIQVTPDPAPLHHGKKQSMSFHLVTTVEDAELAEIEFEDGYGPFQKLDKHASGRSWKGSSPKSEDGQHKYRIKIVTGDGVYELDPMVYSGNPP